MIVNIVCILMVLLIGYWWANQGLFSAIIHLLCVITAGAVALAVWEPLTVGLLLKGSFFDNYAWAFALLVPFVVVLAILRVVTNTLVPGNLDVPGWANFGLGFPVGLASGVLTVGLLVIGLGFVQSQRSLMGFVGYGRDQGGKVKKLDGMWLPVHTLTNDFYGLLSVGSLRSAYPMRQYYPELDRQAAALVRDSWRSGRGQIAMRPSEASVQQAWVCPNRCVVKVRFGRGSRDYGQQLTLSASQARLVAAVSGSAKPYVAHPRRWSQPVKDRGDLIFDFDDGSHYVTTIPGREASDILLEFPWEEGLIPRFVQIKGARIDIRQVTQLADCNEVMAGGGGGSVATIDEAQLALAPAIRQGELRVANDIRPVMTSTNVLPSTMKQQDKLLIEGIALFTRDRQQYSRTLRIQGFYAPAHTRVVQLDVGRRNAANIYGSVRDHVGAKAVPLLVDRQGNTYTAVGYVYEGRDGTEIRLDPTRGLTLDVIPSLPTSGSQKMRLIFHVTTGATIAGFQLDDHVVASGTLYVPEKGERRSTGGTQAPPGGPGS